MRETRTSTGLDQPKALQLVAAGRAMDFALERYRLAKPALERAIQAWRDALAQLPKVAGGEIGNGAGSPRARGLM